jgi:hypothetical protein
MRMRSRFLMSIIFLFAAGCTKDFNIDPGSSKQLYVIDGRISNLEGPYHIRVTKGANSLSNGNFSGMDDAEAVTGAQVIISDDMGAADTLRAPDQSDFRYDPAFSADRGYYVTTKITGIPGHTYHLRVRTGDNTFEASAYMPDNVPAIDSVVLKKDLVADPSGLLGDVAFAYFKEPQDENNYYALQLNAINDSLYDRAHWVYGSTWIFPFYIFDDKTLPPYVNGMEVLALIGGVIRDEHAGFKPNWIIPYDPVQVRLSALTRETYEYLNALEKQFLDDGNVYKPAPASAVGNISGGALGLFWATHISSKVVLR